MKLLYIGHYKEGTGWSQAAIDYILSLDAVGIDVVCQAVKLNQKEVELPSRIIELEKKSLNGVTHIIQHVLPHYMEINTNFYNIAMYIGETQGFGITGWPLNLQLFNQIWVPNEELKTLCKDEFDLPVFVVPHATNIEKYNQNYEPLDIPELKGKFVFYFIGEMNRRKRVSALLKAFHSEFEPDEEVGLLIKTNKDGFSPEQLSELLQAESKNCKEALKKFQHLHYYHSEIFFCSHLSEIDLHRLHKTCDCFVNTSFGEAWSIPTFDAMAHGNLVISSNTGGMHDFLKGPGLLVDGEYEACFGSDSPFYDLNTGHEKWFSISIPDLQRKMRAAFEMSDMERKCKKGWGKRNAENYSYEKVGTIMKGLLDNVA